MSRPVVHFEIHARDFGRITDFYSKAFDWTVDADNPMNYGIVQNEGEGINGGIAQRGDDDPGVMFYIAVPDLQAALDQVALRVGEPGERDHAGDFHRLQHRLPARFADPEGNLIGLVKEQ